MKKEKLENIQLIKMVMMLLVVLYHSCLFLLMIGLMLFIQFIIIG